MDESLGYVIGVLIWAVIWGCITKKINENKGYVGGFAWGFWLGFIGLIVVLCKRENSSSSYRNNQHSGQSSFGDSEYNSALSSYATEKGNQKLISEGGWKCHHCMRVNANYVTTCICGMSKSESDNMVRKISENSTRNTTKSETKSSADELKKFKELLDDGAITQEEYDKKKKQILGL